MSSVDTNQDSGISLWSPFNEFGRLRAQLEDLASHWPGFESLSAGFVPRADVEEAEKEWIVEIELSGVQKKDVEIHVQDRMLVVTGERKEKERTGVLRQKKRVTGTFRYELTVPSDIDGDAVTASMSDGELVIHLPKAEVEQSRLVAIS